MQTERASQGVEARPSCPIVVFPLALGIAVLEIAFLHAVAASLLIVAEVATASFRQSFPWFGVTAVDDRPYSVSPEEKSESKNPRRQ